MIIIYSLFSGIYGIRIITQGVRIRTWVPNTDTPVIKLHSIETTILSLLDDLLESFDNDFPTQLLLLDLSSAFYTINLDLLIYRLKLIGLEDTVLLWFSNYITNRTDSAKINKSISPKRKIIFGVHQGSSLSPILFCIYIPPINKLVKSFLSVKYNMYADDIEIHTDCHKSSNIHLQACLTTINNWFINNYLSLNPNVTVLMNLSPQNSLPTTISPQMYLGHTLIPPSTTSKYLGIDINNKLTFNKHISILKSSTFHHLLNINKIRPYITTSTALTITQTLILSRLHYCIPIILSSHNKYFTNIDRLTNRSLRLIYRLKN